MAARYERDTNTLQSKSPKFCNIPFLNFQQCCVSDKSNTSNENRKAGYNAEKALNVVFADTDSDSESQKTSSNYQATTKKNQNYDQVTHIRH